MDAWLPAFESGLDREAAKAEATGFLIRSAWIRQEARRRGIRIDRAELARAIAERRRQFRRSVDLVSYLRRSGMTKAQFRERVERDALARKLSIAIAAPDLSVSRADVARFYQRHRSEFDQPASRDLRVVVTRSRSAALEARSSLESGRRWGAVAREFTTDASKHTGGRLSIDRTNTIPKLREAVFSVPVGRLMGPLNVRGSWWVFRVDRDRPARQLALSEAAPRIRISIRSTREQFAFDRLTAYLTRRYRPHTVCHTGYSAPECRNRSAGRLAH